MRCHSVTGIQLALDEFFAEEGAFVNGQWYPLSDNLVTELRLRLAAADFEKVTKDNARDAMFYVCGENKFDSAQRWLAAQEWDGKPRVSYFFERCFKCQGDPEYLAAVSLYTWTALAGRVMNPASRPTWFLCCTVGRVPANRRAFASCRRSLTPTPAST